MTFNRRTLLAGLGGTLLLPGVGRAQTGTPAFRTLEAKPAQAVLAGESPSAVLSYDGAVPGPVLRLKKGEELRVRLKNGLDQPTSLHWRGARGAPNDMDGVAPLVQKPVAPGESFDYRFTPPDSGVLLYQPHAEGAFAAQAARGLSGLVVVEDPETPAHDHEIVALLDDWRLDDKGALAPCPGGRAPSDLFSRGEIAGAGRVGPLVTVNGKPAPLASTFAPGARVLLRLANAATARIMILTFEGVRAQVVAIDGQNCDAFDPVRSSIPVGPGARFDVMFDLPAAEGKTASVILRGGELGPIASEPDRPLLTFVTKGAGVAARPPIRSAPLNAALPAVIRLQDAKRLDLTFDAQKQAQGAACAEPGAAVWRINGKAMKPTEPFFAVKRGTPVTLGFVNRSAVPTVMRLHGHVMRQLHLLDDGWEPYWRDSVIVPAGKTVRIAFVADNPGRWRLGGGVLEHAAGGLATWFEVS